MRPRGPHKNEKQPNKGRETRVEETLGRTGMFTVWNVAKAPQLYVCVHSWNGALEHQLREYSYKHSQSRHTQMPRASGRMLEWGAPRGGGSLHDSPGGLRSPVRVHVPCLFPRISSHTIASSRERACRVLRGIGGWRPRKTRPAVSAHEARVSR